MNYWLVKQEPEDYPWTALVKDRRTAWSGVRNFQARNNLRATKKGDRILYYHSGDEKQVVGIARVARAAYPDPTAAEGDWVCVDLAPLKAFKQPVTLAVIRAEPLLKCILLVRQPRLSVIPLAKAEFERLLELGRTRDA
ncbi:MAG TPA: EVE domain-containing protein [Verrucomicrobiae bacterium]